MGHRSVYVTDGVKVEVNAMFGGKRPATIVSSVDHYMEDVKKNQPVHFTVDDAEQIIYRSCKKLL